jgi:hypothetical protein
MRPRAGARPHGQLRRSQVVTTFGPGSLLDLPLQSVLVGGLDDWKGVSEEVHEPRLVEKLKRLLEVPALRLFAPPPESDDPAAPRTGITAWQFPEWFITQDVEAGPGDRSLRSRRLVHRKRLAKGKYIDEDRDKHPVVPVRFVRACRCGHIGDIDWYYFTHRGSTPCRRQLWVDEAGTGGDIADISVRCECGARRRLSDAARPDWKTLGHCDGSRPWLGPFTREECQELNRLLVRSASNAYFPQVMSVISLPDRAESLEKAVNQAWGFLEAVESADDVRYERKKAAVKSALEGFSDDEVFREVQARRGLGGETAVKSVKQAEMEVLAACKEEVGNDVPDGNFYARSLPRALWDRPWMGAVERVVLVHRLREVVAQVGFTRFEALTADVDGELPLEMGVQSAQLAREVTWLPAVENRGEGVFVQFRREAIDAWEKTPAVQARKRQLEAGLKRWQDDHSDSNRRFPEMPYVLLHSLSHLLITSMALECGYPASAIRERVYAVEAGYGILLYTGTPDAEGTLGGLVEAGRNLARHLKAALELGGLCSNDPVCAQHDPASRHESRYLQGAACHGCLLIAETSCEQFNDFLDRALVVPTVEDLGAEFFKV